MWGDPRERESVLQKIAAEGPVITSAVRLLPEAIRAGLNSLGVPILAARSVNLLEETLDPLGLKTPDCQLHFSRDWMVVQLRAGTVDSALATWIHEFVHARRPFSLLAGLDAAWPGYEEGLAEALCRWAVAQAGWPDDHPRPTIAPPAYEWYVQAYHALAEALGVSLPELLIDLARSHPWAVRGRLLQVVHDRRPGLRWPIARWQLDRRLKHIGDQLFGEQYRTHIMLDTCQAQDMRAAWKQALGS